MATTFSKGMSVFARRDGISYYTQPNLQSTLGQSDGQVNYPGQNTDSLVGVCTGDVSPDNLFLKVDWVNIYEKHSWFSSDEIRESRTDWVLLSDIKATTASDDAANKAAADAARKDKLLGDGSGTGGAGNNKMKIPTYLYVIIVVVVVGVISMVAFSVKKRKAKSNTAAYALPPVANVTPQNVAIQTPTKAKIL